MIHFISMIAHCKNTIENIVTISLCMILGPDSRRTLYIAFKELKHLVQSQIQNKKEFHFCLLVKQPREGISIFH